jgi:hypothetical protein
MIQDSKSNENDTPSSETSDIDDEPEDLILKSLHTSLQQIREGKVHPISELWDGIVDTTTMKFH